VGCSPGDAIDGLQTIDQLYTASWPSRWTTPRCGWWI